MKKLLRLLRDVGGIRDRRKIKSLQLVTSRVYSGDSRGHQ